jgi:uncharacterized protein YndB with AHSA1/START domain
MSNQSVVHSTFVIEREYPATPERVFNAWSQPEAREAWATAPQGMESGESTFDFRVGGQETSNFTTQDGNAIRTASIFHDIIPNDRIVYSYELFGNDERASISLATVELIAGPNGETTTLIYTEQGAYLDDLDKPEYREAGMTGILEKLASALESAPAK